MKIKVLDQDRMPQRAHATDAGLDVYTGEMIVLHPGERKKIGLGFCLEIPVGYYGHIEGKSGRASKEGLTTIGNIIDNGYTGEIHAIIVNTSDMVVIINQGEKVAQLVVSPCFTEALEVVEELSTTDRGAGGFGSTGLMNETGTIQSTP